MKMNPIGVDEFADAMRAFAPFERAPDICIAVSGGADSMALVVLADRWAKQNGGRVFALTIDHDLRDGSADEAALVGTWLSDLGIPHDTIIWHDDKPKSSLQAAARCARYQLIEDWCRARGILHLMTAHHADDQAETFLMRVERGSGPDGLAAMAPQRWLKSCRLLRPLLGFPKERLIATLDAGGIAWVEDPSNSDPRFARTAARRKLQSGDVNAAGIAEGVARFQRIRRHLEMETSTWLARHASLSPIGTLDVSAPDFDALSEEIRLRVLSRAAMTIGGQVYPPNISAVERLATSIRDERAATLSGALFVAEGQCVRIFREARNLPARQLLSTQSVLWDRRIEISGHVMGADATVEPWSPDLAANWDKNLRPAWYSKLSHNARQGLPIVFINGEFRVPDPWGGENNGISMRFSPIMPLSGAGFSVA